MGKGAFEGYIRVPKDFVVTYNELSMGSGEREKFTSKLINISVHNILFESEKKYTDGTVIKLEFQMPRWEKFSPEFMKFDRTSISKPFVAIGQVGQVWEYEKDRYLLGVELKNVDTTHSEALRRYLAHLWEKSEGNNSNK